MPNRRVHHRPILRLQPLAMIEGDLQELDAAKVCPVPIGGRHLISKASLIDFGKHGCAKRKAARTECEKQSQNGAAK